MARPNSRHRRRVGPQELSSDADRARVGLDEPAGDPEESRLARSVLADEGVDLAGAAVEADIGQRPDRPELAGDPAQFEDDVQGRLSWIAWATHPSGYIRASTSSGTRTFPRPSASPDPGHSRVGHLTHHVRDHDLARDLGAGDVHHLGGPAVREVAPAENQMLVGLSLAQSQNRVCSSVRTAMVMLSISTPSNAVYRPSAYS